MLIGDPVNQGKITSCFIAPSFLDTGRRTYLPVWEKRQTASRIVVLVLFTFAVKLIQGLWDL